MPLDANESVPRELLLFRVDVEKVYTVPLGSIRRKLEVGFIHQGPDQS